MLTSRLLLSGFRFDFEWVWVGVELNCVGRAAGLRVLWCGQVSCERVLLVPPKLAHNSPNHTLKQPNKATAFNGLHRGRCKSQAHMW